MPTHHDLVDDPRKKKRAIRERSAGDSWSGTCRRSGWTRVHRRLPASRRSRATDIDPLEQHRELVYVDRYARDPFDHAGRKYEGPRLGNTRTGFVRGRSEERRVGKE